LSIQGATDLDVFNNEMVLSITVGLISMLQVYHKYKAVATKFLQKRGQNDCIKSGQLLYHKRTSS